MLDSLHVLMVKARKDLREEIKIPEGINASLEGNKLIMKNENGEVQRKINPILDVKLAEGKIILEFKKATKKEKKILKTHAAHIKNMANGLTKKFKYTLQVVAVHFPINVKFDNDTNELIVKNFLGEKKDRRIKLISGVDVRVNKDIIELESVNIEKAGQTAANIEKGTRVRKKDRRIFQDGIFITQKPGRSFL